MRSGRLGTLITFEKCETLQDTAGQPVERWTPADALKNIRAEVNNGRGKKFESAQQRVPSMTHLITVRYIPGVDVNELTRMRIRVGTRILNIEAPPANPLEQNREYQFSCIEVIPT